MPKKTAVLAMLAAFALLLSPLFPSLEAEAQEDKPIIVYTAQTATTAQLPLMAAIKAGWPGEGATVKVKYWKNLDDLRALALAGKGDVWVGHVEALARAAAATAPVTLIEITAWRKFFLISLPLPFKKGADERHPRSVEELVQYSLENGLRLGSSPPNSPMTALLRRLGGDGLAIDSLPPQQLILELSSGKRSAGMLPEPMASVAALKNPRIAVVGSLEQAYASQFGGPDWQPQAAVAVNRAFLERSPALVASLVEMMGPLAEELAKAGPKEAAAALPLETIEAIGLEALKNSLEREIIKAVPASEIRQDVESFLRQAAPELYQEGAAAPPESLFLPKGE
jgi:NitT/TauT family transport system substrate-binding protein